MNVAALDERPVAEDLLHCGRDRLGSVDDEQEPLSCVQTAGREIL